MAGNRLEKYYSSFGGLDTRSNKLLSNPKTFRAGSKNFRYNFQDELQKANGFQHKNLSPGFINLGDIEYKYTDQNTGEEKSELLCVGSDGLLYRIRSHFLKITNLASATKYSFYYDEVADEYKFVLDGGYAAITVNSSFTMNQLKTAINGFGLSCDIVDDSGATVTSSKLAYYMDVTIDETLSLGVVTKASSRFWEVIEYPSKANNDDQVPFITSLNYYADPDYEGISSVNLNNSVYICDGGFVMKYDGKCVYRAGIPKILKPNQYGTANLNGFIITPTTAASGALTANQIYQYVYQAGFVDHQGSLVIGDYETSSEHLHMSINTGTTNAIENSINPIYRALDFPIFSCLVSGDQDIAASGGTITVAANHNIKVGMLLRIPVSNAALALPGYSYLMTRASAVTSTTISVELGMANASIFVTNPFGANFNAVGFHNSGFSLVSVSKYTTYPTLNPNYNYIAAGQVISGSGIQDKTFVVSANIQYPGATNESKDVVISKPTTTTTTGQTYSFYSYHTLLVNQQIINGGYAADSFKNTVGTPNSTNYWNPEIKFGAFLRVFRTVGNTDNLYRNIDLPLSHKYSQVYVDKFSDADAVNELSRLSILDSDVGGPLPRPCRYLTEWQGSLIQSGRPLDVSMLDQPYPGAVFSQYANLWGYPDDSYLGYKYTEADICDFQSVYWNNTPEGFPQDGLHEFQIKTKFNDRIKGVAENKDALFAFKERSTGVLVGSLAENDITLEVLEADVGCANHRTIKDVQGSLIWLDPVNGFFSCVAGRLPENIGFPISDQQKINLLKLDYSNACAGNFRKESLYVCSVGTTTFVYDYAYAGQNPRNCWYYWDRINVKSILSTSNDELLLNDGSITWKMKTTNSVYDFTDHKSAIDFLVNMAWLTAGAPTIDKHWIALWVNSIQGGFALDFTQYGNFLDTVIGSKLGVDFASESLGKKAVKLDFKAATPKLSGTSFGIRNNQKNKWVRIQGLEVQLSNDFDSGEPKK